jgi:hypothetical protein
LHQPETGGASGPGPAFRQFARIGDEIAYATCPDIANRRRRTRCIKAWHKRGDFLGDIAVIIEMEDRGSWIGDKRNAQAPKDRRHSDSPRQWTAHETAQSPLPFNNQHSTLINRQSPLLRSNILSVQISKNPARSSPVLRLVSSSLVSFPNLGNPAAQNMKLLYVGMTQAKERLMITASGKNDFTERLGSMTRPVCAVA